MDEDERLVDASDVMDCLWGKLGLALLGRVMLHKSSTQLSADRCGCAPSK